MTGFVVGITGGIASGKSLVEASFADLGVEVVDADKLAREIVQPGMPALAEIAERFGPAVLLPDGSLDRARLRELVFADASARAALEAITHPRIAAALRERCAAATGRYCIASIPLLAEAEPGRYAWLSKILVVDAPEALRRQRLLSRDGTPEAQATQILAAQATRSSRLALASDVLVNDGSVEDVRAAVARLHARYLRLATR